MRGRLEGRPLVRAILRPCCDELQVQNANSSSASASSAGGWGDIGTLMERMDFCHAPG